MTFLFCETSAGAACAEVAGSMTSAVAVSAPATSAETLLRYRARGRGPPPGRGGRRDVVSMSALLSCRGAGVDARRLVRAVGGGAGGAE
ncbi:hypothetical protein JCM18897A_50850 [Streptomyces sp. JCM 18897]|uniref:Uncharacterized protein n=1 Tax=Streptomyces albidoflavus TaxID=1886 RepID=A0AA37FAR2_9ACTN|nr:hypothetical protein MTP02_09140 [Streptomyces albus]GHI45021.1 hypothetical protein ScoT_11950 [Streptomyces albidoflavus]